MVQLGIEVLLTDRMELIRGKAIGLVTNYTMTDSHYRPVIDLLAENREWQLKKLFGPEHGVQNAAKEGEHVHSGIDSNTGLPVFSLYGETRKPTSEMLSALDAIVMDLQDIGSRYYTNMNTVYYCMEACAALGLPCIILDRPNPINGVTREGIILESEFRSFVGLHLIPNRHGLTMGELAQFFNQNLKPQCDLTVVETRGWLRTQLLSETNLPFVPSSPNTTNLDMCLLYPGTCFFEGVNVSLGRGTTHPFEVVGAPYIDGHRLSDWFNAQKLPGVVSRPTYFTPTYSQYTGELCKGIQLHVIDSKNLESVRTGVTLLQGIHDLFPNLFEFIKGAEGRPLFIDLLAGTDELRRLVEEGEGLRYLTESREGVERFTREIKDFELY
ncbi:DUF1343 domain-containing protein [Pullulanibacillus sp. KACC 23026]|uniref:exo-beta-N-acetylmuramidase NamZ family protein n=1 Tax=Pullulanibacillus sp. KACC 23026 TaxID=3028315 RepID=UPI0023B1187F|nr:DUF1343 domain-containing protein [Pullulanibacillus sp. KACC 23026]WEG14740.1 DUF1343 domain-containing protein [Pullulanibacillus sp. KACC 23026]